jgi:hypothetical protein
MFFYVYNLSFMLYIMYVSDKCFAAQLINVNYGNHIH